MWEEAANRVNRGEISAKFKEGMESMFALSSKVTILKQVKGGIFDETLYGSIRKTDTAAQLAIPNVTHRRNADYFRASETLSALPVRDNSNNGIPLNTYAIQATYLTFLIDGAIAFYALTEHGLHLTDAAACSTLDFAVRFHEDEFDFQDFHLREMRTYSASRERTFSEALVWDLKGKLIASATQQCVLRPKKEKAKM
jgi:acyl-CoA thioesterase